MRMCENQNLEDSIKLVSKEAQYLHVQKQLVN